VDSPAARAVFQSILDEVMLGLAKWVVKDAEGSKQAGGNRVSGAVSDSDARRIADTIAHSPLVKTPCLERTPTGTDFGCGGPCRSRPRSGKRGYLHRPGPDGVQGIGCGEEAEAAATRVLKTDEFSLTVDLHLGAGRAVVYTCDLSIDYVKINADYRS